MISEMREKAQKRDAFSIPSFSSSSLLLPCFHTNEDSCSILPTHLNSQVPQPSLNDLNSSPHSSRPPTHDPLLSAHVLEEDLSCESRVDETLLSKEGSDG